MKHLAWSFINCFLKKKNNQFHGLGVEINQKTYLRNSPEGVGASGDVFEILITRDAAVVIQPPMMDKE